MICVLNEVIGEKTWHGSFVVTGSVLASKWRRAKGARHKDETALPRLGLRRSFTRDFKNEEVKYEFKKDQKKH